ncbi:site-specific integrase [Pantoea eucrina]|uniref:Site-specific integrase n=1 Tax=Pantoea eucrina TaxID=472693 RepID=A0ABU5LE11_9GAMM|nr:tyrosine-type recombinase/integrase [Pantoea eucrina]MDZ7278179.1 site-specific integrase [Pantoea eucrina]
MTHLNELAATAKAFLLDNPEATPEELRGHLKDMAESLLTAASGDYWDGVEVSHLHDAKANLREIAAKHSLSIEQHHHLAASLKIIDAAQKRVNGGDAGPLLDILKGLEATHAAHDGDSTTILKSQQGNHSPELTRERLEFDELSSIYMAEHMVNLLPASQRDIQSAHKALKRFTKGIDWRTHTREQVRVLRDAMRDSGLADSTVNKMMAKLSAVMNWAFQNGHIDHDYTKGLKVKGVVSSRRAFTEDELVKVVSAVAAERELHKRLFGMLAVITGARCGELTQLTKADVVNEAGHLCIDINDRNSKTLKNKGSARVIPLIDGAYGFSINEFSEWVRALPDDNSLVFGMSRDIASKWFNEKVLPTALPDRDKNLVLHSLRHTMATLMKKAGVTESVAQDVLGHSNQSITFGLYGKAKSVNLMADALNKTLGV